MLTMNGNESPIEDVFEHQMWKFMLPGLVLEKQSPAPTAAGTFRLDFMLAGDRKVGFECDGEEFHDARRDEFRDAFILGEGHVETIYRFSGSALNGHASACLLYVALCDPWIFEERASAVLRLASRNEADGRERHFDRPSEYADIISAGDSCGLAVRRTAKPGASKLQADWRRLYDFGRHCGGNLQHMIDLYEQYQDEKRSKPRY